MNPGERYLAGVSDDSTRYVMRLRAERKARQYKGKGHYTADGLDFIVALDHDPEQLSVETDEYSMWVRGGDLIPLLERAGAYRRKWDRNLLRWVLPIKYLDDIVDTATAERRTITIDGQYAQYDAWSA